VEKEKYEGGILVVKDSDLEVFIQHSNDVEGEGSEFLSSQGEKVEPVLDEVVRMESRQAELGVVNSEEVRNISVKQMMADTRYSARLHEKKVEKIQVNGASSKKRSLEDISLSNQNSFVVLSNDSIASIVGDMCIIVQPSDFDKVDLLRDIEIARNALKNPKLVAEENADESHQLDTVVDVGEVPLLEWLDENSEAEQFTLVQSRKKKKKSGILLSGKSYQRWPSEEKSKDNSFII
jgi:hypothetical protein